MVPIVAGGADSGQGDHFVDVRKVIPAPGNALVAGLDVRNTRPAGSAPGRPEAHHFVGAAKVIKVGGFFGDRRKSLVAEGARRREGGSRTPAPAGCGDGRRGRSGGERGFEGACHRGVESGCHITCDQLPSLVRAEVRVDVRHGRTVL